MLQMGKLLTSPSRCLSEPSVRPGGGDQSTSFVIPPSEIGNNSNNNNINANLHANVIQWI